MAFFVGRKSRTTNHFTITKHNSYIHMCCFKCNEKQQNIAMVLWVGFVGHCIFLLYLPFGIFLLSFFGTPYCSSLFVHPFVLRTIDSLDLASRTFHVVQ